MLAVVMYSLFLTEVMIEVIILTDMYSILVYKSLKYVEECTFFTKNEVT